MHLDYPMPASVSAMQRSGSTPSHLDSRTRKRFRDNRPDEQTVHGTCKTSQRAFAFSDWILHLDGFFG